MYFFYLDIGFLSEEKNYTSGNLGSSALDTLPEDRASDPKKGEYRRVYHDWKPSVEKTDWLGTIHAIEGNLIKVR